MCTHKYYILLVILLSFLITLNDCKTAKRTCKARAKFGDPYKSEYILPFPVGKSYVCSQSYCNPNGGHKNQLAYDFALTIGDSVIAARSGIVKELKQDQPDSPGKNDSVTHNYIMIEHRDGSVAFYAHLKQNSVRIKPGDSVKQGKLIALSGNSGYTANFPHLHFGVYKSYPPVETKDVPVNFRNAEGPLDENNGLIANNWYKALKYQ